MSTTIDERVVEMRFDNKNFEKNVSTTMSTLDKLKAKLHLPGAAKGLSDLAKHSGVVRKNMDVLGQGVNNVKAEFSGLSVVGATCLVNLTNSAIRAGKNIVNALTLDPVRTGFQEYETKIGAIQTILANTSSKGEDIESVTKVIDELNTYADKTIYNFSEMTRNIGTFTAAGVGLKESAAAIQGIANVAAVSGSTSQQASTAMYQLSQALAAGTVKLMDWNSVVNAGMGGEKLQEALKQTAREYGTDVDAMIKKAGSFRESLSEEWITAEVLNTTLKKFTVEGAKEYANSMLESGKYTQEQADNLMKEAQMAEDAATKVKTLTQLWDTLKETAQSGWGKTWELIVGDFEEAKTFFTELNDKLSPIIDGMSDARNNLIESALTSKWSRFSKYITDAGGSMDQFKTALASVIKEKHGLELDGYINRFGSLENVIKKGKIPTDEIIEAFDRLSGKSAEASKTVESAAGKLEQFQKVVDRIWAGDYGNDKTRFAQLEKEGYDYKKVQDLVNKTVDGHRLTLEDLNETQLENIGCTKQEIQVYRKLAKEAKDTGTPLRELIDNIQKPSGRELLLKSIMNIINAAIKLGSTIKKAFAEIFLPADTSVKSMSEGLYGLIERFEAFTERLVLSDESAEKLKSTFKGIFSVIKLVTTILHGGLKIAMTILQTILSAFNLDILDLTAYIGDAVAAISDWITNTIDVRKVIEFLVPYIKIAVEKVREFANMIAETSVVSKLLVGDFKGAFNEIYGWLKEKIDAIKKLITSFVDGSFNDTDSLIDAGKNMASNVINGIVSYFSETFPKVTSFVKTSFENIVNAIKNLPWGSISASLFSALSIVSMFKLLSKLSNIVDVIKSIVGKVTDLVGVYIKSMSKLMRAKAIKQEAIAILILAVAITIIVKAIAELGSMDLAALIQGGTALIIIAGVLIGLTIAVGKLAKVSKDSPKTIAGILALASSLLIVSAAIWMLSMIDSDGLGTAIKGLAAAVIALLALTFVMNDMLRTTKPAQIDAIGTMLLKMSVAFLIMAKVVDMASEFSDEQIRQASKTLWSVGGLFAVAIIVSKFAGEHGSKAGSMLLKMSIAFGIMTFVVRLAANISEGTVRKASKTLWAIEGLFAVAVIVSKFAGEHGAKAGSMLLKMAVAIAIMVGVVKLISMMDEKDVEAGMGFIAVILSMFTALVAVSAIAGENAGKVGLMFLGLSVALAILAGTIGIFSLIDDEAALNRSVAAVSAIIGMLSILVAATENAKDAAKTMFAIAVVIGLLGGLLIALTFVGAEELKRSVAALSIVMLSLAAVLWATKSLQNVKSGKLITTFLGMALIIGAIGYVITEMDGIDSTNAIKNATALSILLLAMSGSMLILGKVADMKWGQMAKLGVGLAGLAVILSLLGLVLSMMSVMHVEDAITNATALTILLGAVSGAFVVLTKFGTDINWGQLAKLGAGMLALSGIMAILGLVLAMMSKFDTKNSIENAIALGILMAVMTASIAVMTKIGTMTPGILLGGVAMLLLSGVMAILGLILAMMSNMDTKNAIPNAIALGILILALSVALIPLNAIGATAGFAIAGCIALAVLAAVLGAAIKAFMAWIAPDLPELGTHLSKFMKRLEDFIKGAKKIDAKAAEGCKFLAEMMMALAGAGILDTIASIFGGDNWIDSIAENLLKFGVVMVKFSNILVKGHFNSAIVTAAAIAGQILMNLYNSMPKSGGLLSDLWSSIFGDSDVGEFGKQLEKYGECIVAFANSVKGLKTDGIKKAQAAGEIMVALAKDIPNSGGVLGFIMGENDIDDFGNKLKTFGWGIKQFSITVKNLDTSGVEKAQAAGLMMTALAQEIPNSGGVLGWLAGNNDIDDFGNKLKTFGWGIKQFSIIVKGLDISGVENAKTAGLMMTALAQEIPNSGGVLGWLVGNNDIDDFGERLEKYGNSIAKFSWSVTGLHTASIEAAAKASEALMKLQVPDTGWFNDDLDDFAEYLPPFGEGMKAFSEAVAGVEEENMKSAANSVKHMNTAIKNLPEEGCMDGKMTSADAEKIKNVMPRIGDAMSAYSRKFKNVDTSNLIRTTSSLKSVVSILKDIGDAKIGNTKNFSSALKELDLDSIVSSISGSGEKFKMTGADLIAKLKEGISGKLSTVTTAIKNIVNRAVSTVKTGYNSMYNAGSYLTQGLANGLSDNSWRVRNAATNVMNRAIEAANKAADINSPSKVFYEMGGYVVAGLVNALDDLGGRVYDSGYRMADNARRGFGGALSRITSEIDEDALSPTIRPVLDMSSVESGVSAMNGLFNTNHMVGLRTNVNAVTRMMANRQNGASNDDVVRAINGLREEMGNVGTTNNYIDGVTYDDGSGISEAVATIVRAARVERRR